MKYLIYFLTILLLFSLDIGLFSFFKLGGTVPNLLFLAAIIFSLDKESYDFFFVGLVAGLYLDFYTASFPGTFSLGFVALGLIFNQAARNILVFEINWKYLSLVLVAGEILLGLFLWAYSQVIFKIGWIDGGLDFTALKQRFIFQLFYDLLFLYPVYVMVFWLKKFIIRLSQKPHRVI